MKIDWWANMNRYDREIWRDRFASVVSILGIVIFILAIVMFYFLVLAPLFATSNAANPCPSDTRVPISQACIDARFDSCIKAEKYSREECLKIATTR